MTNPDTHDDATDTSEVTTETQEPTEQQETDTPNSEAARYRRQLRDTEATLSTTTTRLAAYQRRAAEQAIADVLSTPGDLFDVGLVDIADYIDENGEILSEELTDAAKSFVTQRPQLGTGYYPPTIHFEHGPMGGPVHDGPSWAKALAPERRV